jgi:hypothetical protein
MDSQSSVSLPYDPDRMDVLRFATCLLPSREYKTQLLNFPITNCHEPYGTTGDFFLSCTVYRGGKRFARVDLPAVRQDGFIEFDFDHIFAFGDVGNDAILIAQYSHDKSIPVELYMSNVHRATGAYLAYPALAFMGDVLYPTVHDTQLENTLFWPGLPSTPEIDAQLIVVNPYKMRMEYQLSLFLPSQRRVQSEIIAIDGYHSKTHSIAEVFSSDYREAIAQGAGQASVCISAQYKVVAMMTMKNVNLGVISSVDHLHTYQLV